MSTYEMIGQYIKVIGALLIVLLLIYASMQIGKKYRRMTGKKSYIQVIETVPIYHKSALVIADIAGKYMVLSVSENNTQVISQLSEEEINLIKKEDGFMEYPVKSIKEFIMIKKQEAEKKE